MVKNQINAVRRMGFGITKVMTRLQLSLVECEAMIHDSGITKDPVARGEHVKHAKVQIRDKKECVSRLIYNTLPYCLSNKLVGLLVLFRVVRATQLLKYDDAIMGALLRTVDLLHQRLSPA